MNSRTSARASLVFARAWIGLRLREAFKPGRALRPLTISAVVLSPGLMFQGVSPVIAIAVLILPPVAALLARAAPRLLDLAARYPAADRPVFQLAARRLTQAGITLMILPRLLGPDRRKVLPFLQEVARYPLYTRWNLEPADGYTVLRYVDTQGVVRRLRVAPATFVILPSVYSVRETFPHFYRRIVILADLDGGVDRLQELGWLEWVVLEQQAVVTELQSNTFKFIRPVNARRRREHWYQNLLLVLEHVLRPNSEDVSRGPSEIWTTPADYQLAKFPDYAAKREVAELIYNHGPSVLGYHPAPVPAIRLMSPNLSPELRSVRAKRIRRRAELASDSVEARLADLLEQQERRRPPI